MVSAWLSLALPGTALTANKNFVSASLSAFPYVSVCIVLIVAVGCACKTIVVRNPTFEHKIIPERKQKPQINKIESSRKPVPYPFSLRPSKPAEM